MKKLLLSLSLFVTFACHDPVRLENKLVVQEVSVLDDSTYSVKLRGWDQISKEYAYFHTPFCYHAGEVLMSPGQMYMSQSENMNGLVETINRMRRDSTENAELSNRKDQELRDVRVENAALRKIITKLAEK